MLYANGKRQRECRPSGERKEGCGKAFLLAANIRAQNKQIVRSVPKKSVVLSPADDQQSSMKRSRPSCDASETARSSDAKQPHRVMRKDRLVCVNIRGGCIEDDG